MIEVVIIGSPIRNGFRRVQVGMSTFVDEAMAIALVNGGRAVYKTPPAPSDAPTTDPSDEAATPAPTEAEAPVASEPTLTETLAPVEVAAPAPQEKPKTKRSKR